MGDAGNVLVWLHRLQAFTYFAMWHPILGHCTGHRLLHILQCSVSYQATNSSERPVQLFSINLDAQQEECHGVLLQCHVVVGCQEEHRPFHGGGQVHLLVTTPLLVGSLSCLILWKLLQPSHLILHSSSFNQGRCHLHLGLIVC